MTAWLQQMNARYINWVLDHPVLALVLSLLLVAVASFSIKDIRTNDDPRQFFSAENEIFKRFTDVESRFGSNESIVIVVAPKNGDVFTRDNLILLEKLTADAWTLPKSTRVDSLVNFQHTDVDGDDLTVRDLVSNAQDLSADDIKSIRELALAEPSLTNNLVSKTGHVAGIAVTEILEFGKEEAPIIAAAARKLVQGYRERHPDVDFYISGTVVFSDANNQATREGMGSLAALALVAVVLCMLVILRGIQGTVITLLIVVMSMTAAVGTGIWTGIVFSPLASLAPVIILTLAIADCVHLLISYNQYCMAGMSKRDAMAESLRVNMQPVFVTSITTIPGFLFMNAADSPPFRDMGNLVVFGVIYAWLLAILMLPALVMLLPGKPKARTTSTWGMLIMEKLAHFIISRYRKVLAVTAIISAALIACIPLNQFNDVWAEYFDETYEVRRASDFMMKELSGMFRLEFAVKAQESQGTMDPEFVRHVDEFVAWASLQPEVAHATSFTDVIKRLNQDMHRGDKTWYKVPDERELISQYVLMYEMSLPFGLGTDNLVDFDKSAMRVTMILHKAPANDIMRLEQRSYAWMQQHWPEHMWVHGTGLDTLFGTIAKQNSVSMISGTIYALITVSLMLIVALGSLKYGLLSMLPNLLPAAISFGLWGLVHGQIGIAVSVVACMTIGIVVDDTTHFISKYVRAKREMKMDTATAAEYTLKHVGGALVATSVILCANFAVLATSHFAPNADMGLLTTITLAVALFINFFFFVPLLLVIDRRHKQKLQTTAQQKSTESSLAKAA